MSHALPPLPEPPQDEADPWDDFRRGLLTAIQVTAMGLVLCILVLMYTDDKLRQEKYARRDSEKTETTRPKPRAGR